MLVPGSNLLNIALGVIARQTFDYYAFVSRAPNPFFNIGQDIATYAPPVTAQGSVQAVPRELFEQLGLDLNKHYRKFFVPQTVVDIERDVSGDLFIFENSAWQPLSITPWYGVDGWVEVLTTKIVNVPLVTAITPPAAGRYNTGATISFELTFNQTVIVAGTPQLALSGLNNGFVAGNAVYVSGSGTNALTFSYTVQANDNTAGIAVQSPVQLVNSNGVTFGSINDSTGVLWANGSFTPPNLSGVRFNA